MSTALIRCHTTVILVGHHEEKGIATPTLNALQRRSLLAQGRDKKAKLTWKPSRAGLVLISAEEPRFLAQQSQKGYTTVPGLAVFGEPEAIDEQSQRFQTADAHDRLDGLPGRRHDRLVVEAQNLSRRLRQTVRCADVSSLEVVAQLERIRLEIARLEDLRAA